MVCHSFKELAAALNIKAKRPKAEVVRRCPKCGSAMKHIEGTNIYTCEYVELVEMALNDKPVLVFRKCDSRVFE